MTYSTSLSMGKQRFAVRGQNDVSFRQTSNRLGPISNAIVLIVLVCLIGLVYVTQVIKTNAYSYQIQELQTKQTTLKEDQKNLELNAARLRSIESAAVANANQSFVSVAPSGSIQ